MKPISKRRFLSLTAFCLLAGGTAAGAARPAAAPFMTSGAPADAPAGFVEMCARDYRLCAAPPVVTAQLASTVNPQLVPTPAVVFDTMPMTRFDDRAAMQIIRSVNSHVNRHVVAVADLQATGTYDRWERPSAARGNVGDCEDFAIEKRARLLEQGFDPSRLFYAVAYKRGYGLHTVLIARLEAGDYVLDNMSPHVLNWSEVRYSWLRRQSAQNPMEWHRVETGSTVAATDQSATKQPA